MVRTKYVQGVLFGPRGGASKRSRAKANARRKRRTHGDRKSKTQREKRPVGRPKKGLRASERHERRETLKASEPVHVVVRALPRVGSLRKRDLFLAIREATIVVTARDDFRIAHLSIQRTHLHLIVEASDKHALAGGMKRFLISAAKQINRALGARSGSKCRGSVFSDRYHPRILRTLREVRNCIAYVLNNWRHHGEDKHAFARDWTIDPYSSAISFFGWKELAGADLVAVPRPPPNYHALIVWLPKTWLLRSWTRQRRISVYEVPGGSHAEG